jgi:hypothetical protein
MEFRSGGNGLIAAIADGDFEAIAFQEFFEPEEDVGIVFDD